MNEETKKRTVNLEDLQAGVQQTFNKVIGNEGVCTTAAATAAKAVTLGSTFDLVSGATILVTFTNGISVANATLAVTHTLLGGSSTTESAKPIYYRGAALPANLVKAGDKLLLRYDGTAFNVIGVLDQDLSGKADKSATVSNISYDSATGKLKKTINGTTTDVCDVVQSGFVPTFNPTTGIANMAPVGGATIAPNASTGLIAMTF